MISSRGERARDYIQTCAPESQVRTRLAAGGRWIQTSGSWSDLLRRDALPGDLPVFFAFAGLARRRNEDHALALEAHPAHLIAADPSRIRRRVNPRDKPLAIIGVVTAIGAIFPADAGRQLRPSVAYNGHHAPVSGQGEAAERLAAVRQRARRARCVPGSGVEKFPGTYDGLHPVFSRGKHL